MDKQIMCPNCEESLQVPSGSAEHECPRCGAVLDVSGHTIEVVARPSEAFRGEERTGVPPDDHR